MSKRKTAGSQPPKGIKASKGSRSKPGRRLGRYEFVVPMNERQFQVLRDLYMGNLIQKAGRRNATASAVMLLVTVALAYPDRMKRIFQQLVKDCDKSGLSSFRYLMARVNERAVGFKIKNPFGRNRRKAPGFGFDGDPRRN